MTKEEVIIALEARIEEVQKKSFQSLSTRFAHEYASEVAGMKYALGLLKEI
jgi:hypothetical protein